MHASKNLDKKEQKTFTWTFFEYSMHRPAPHRLPMCGMLRSWATSVLAHNCSTSIKTGKMAAFTLLVLSRANNIRQTSWEDPKVKGHNLAVKSHTIEYAYIEICGVFLWISTKSRGVVTVWLRKWHLHQPTWPQTAFLG